MGSFYYDWTKIDGYKCPVKCVISKRGLGKTFGKLKYCVEKFLTKGERFVYIVETGDMVKELAKNNGEKFWSAILEYYSGCDTSRKRYFYSKLTSMNLDDEDDENIFKRNVNAKLCGATIKINGETAGYLLDMNSFGEIKRNNFVSVKTVIIDEFISEKFDKTTFENPRKINSIIQSIARLRDINIYLLGNAIRKEDSLLSRMGFKIENYGIYKKYDDYGLVMVLDFVNPDEYEGFSVAHNKSVAGRFSRLLGETNEEDNKFLSDIPDDRRLRTFKFKRTGLSLNIVKENTIVSIKELEDGNLACIPFSNNRVQNLYCLTEKEQGFKLGYTIICNKELKQILYSAIRSNIIYYYSEIEYAKLKYIIKGD